jgi:hypothetical protein
VVVVGVTVLFSTNHHNHITGEGRGGGSGRTFSLLSSRLGLFLTIQISSTCMHARLSDFRREICIFFLTGYCCSVDHGEKRYVKKQNNVR